MSYSGRETERKCVCVTENMFARLLTCERKGDCLLVREKGRMCV